MSYKYFCRHIPFLKIALLIAIETTCFNITSLFLRKIFFFDFGGLIEQFVIHKKL